MRRGLREAILWIGAALGTVCLVWTGVMFAFGLTPLVFTSGSMSPAIDAGDLAFARTVEAKDLARGDVVSVINDRGTRITHRITHIDRQDDGDAILQLKGDANRAPDQEPYRVTEVERVSFSVPMLGYVINVVGSPNGMFVGGLAVAGLLYLGFRKQDDESREPVQRVVMVSAVLVSLGLVSSSGATQPTTAAFTDGAAVASGQVAAAGLPDRPSSITCRARSWISLAVVVSWADDNSRYGYRYEVDDDPAFGSPEATGFIAPNGSNEFTINSTVAGGWFSSSTYYFRVFSTWVDGAGNPTWSSSSYRAYRVNRLGFFNDFSCQQEVSP